MARRSSIMWMVGAAVAFSAMAVLVKGLSTHLSGFEIVFYRSAIHLLCLAPMLRRQRINPVQEVSGLILLRSLLGFTGIACFFFSLGRMEAGLATLVQWTAPGFTLVFAQWVLKERAPRSSWILLFCAFCGVVVSTHSMEFTSINIEKLQSLLLALLGALSAGCSYGLLKKVTSQASETSLAFWFSAVAFVGAFFGLKGELTPPPFSLLPSLIAVGASVTFYQYAVTRAYRESSAVQVAPFSLLPAVFTEILEAVLHARVPGLDQILGTLLVVISLGYLVRLKHQKATEFPSTPAVTVLFSHK